jgi:hypothetical protein
MLGGCPGLAPVLKSLLQNELHPAGFEPAAFGSVVHCSWSRLNVKNCPFSRTFGHMERSSRQFHDLQILRFSPSSGKGSVTNL